MKPQKNISKILLNSAAVIVVLGAVVSVMVLRQTPDMATPDTSIVTATELLRHTPTTRTFDAPLVGARAVHILDVNSGRTLYSKNADEEYAIASLTKIMTALVAAEESPDPNNHVVQIDAYALVTDGESGFWYGEQWNLADLIEFTLVSSSNDGAAAIAAALTSFVDEPTFVDAMNTKASELGLTHTRFKNPTGLDINFETEPGAFGSARDMSTLFAHVLIEYPELLEATQVQTVAVASLDRLHSVDNTNNIVNAIPWVLGAKTGYTDRAGGNLVVAFEAGPGRPIVVTVLGSTKDGRFSDMEALIDATLTHISA